MDLSINGCWDCARPVTESLLVICIGLIALTVSAITRSFIAKKYLGIVKLLYGVTALWYALATYAILTRPPFWYGYYLGQNLSEPNAELFPFGSSETLVIGWNSFSIALVLLIQQITRKRSA